MKERKKRKKFSFKRALMYTATYVVVTFCVALFMVLNTSTTLSKGNTISFAPYTPSAIEQVIGSITESEDLSLNANLVLSSGEEIIGNADIDINVQFGTELTDIKVNANLNVQYKDEVIEGSVYFVDNILYVSLLEGNYQIETSSLMDAISNVATLFGLNLDELMSSLDPSALGGMVSDDNVTANENGYSITINLGDFEIVLITDAEYNLQEVKMPKITLEDYDVNIGAKVTSRNVGMQIAVPENEWVDLTQSVKVINALANSLNNSVYMQANVAFGDNNFTGYAQIKGSDLALFGDIAFGDINAQAVLENNNLYLSAMGINAKANLNDYKDYLAVLKEFGIDIGVDTKLDIDQIFSTISNLSLDVIESITENESIVTLTLTNGMIINFDVTGEKLQSINFAVSDVEITLYVVEGEIQKPTIIDEDYFDAKHLLPLVPTIADIVETKGVSGVLNITYAEQTYQVNYLVDFSEGVSAQLTTNILDKNIKVTYLNNLVYFKIDDFRAFVTLEQLNSLISVPSVALSDVDLGLNVDSTNEGVILNVIGNVINIITTDGGLQVVANISGVDIEANVNATSVKVELEDANDYLPLDIQTVIDNITKIVDNSKLDITATIKAGDLDVYADVKVDFATSLIASANIDIDGIKLQLVLQNNEIFIDAYGLKVRTSLTELPNIITDILNQFDVTLSTDFQFDLDYDGLNIILSIAETNIAINTTSFDIDVISSDLSVKVVLNEITDNFAVTTLTQQQIKEYTNDAKDLVVLLGAVRNIINQQYIAGIVKVYVNDQVYTVDINYQNVDGQISVEISTTLPNTPIKLIYYGDVIYLDILENTYYFDIDSIKDFETKFAYLLGDANISEVLTNLLSSFDMQQLDLSTLTFSEQGIEFRMNELYLSLGVMDGVFNILEIEYRNVLAFAYLTYGVQEQIQLPDANECINLLDVNSLSGTLTLTTGIDNYVINYLVNFNGGLSANLSTTLFGYEINVTLLEEIIYLQLDEFKAYVTLQDLQQLLTNMSVEMPTIDVDVEFTLHKLVLEIADYLVDISIAGNQIIANSTIEGYDITATLTLGNNQVQIITTEYLPLDVDYLVENITNIINDKKLDLTAQVKFGDTTITIGARLDFANGLIANLSTSYMGLDALITIQNNQLYIDINGAKITASLSDLPTIIKDILGVFDKTMGGDITLGYDGTNIVVAVGDMVAKLNIANNFAYTTISGTGLDITLNVNEITEDFAVVTLTPTEISTYTNNATNIVSVAQVVKNLINQNYIHTKLNVTFDDTAYLFDLRYQNINDSFAVELSGNLFDKSLNVTYINDVIYISVLGMNYYFDVDDFGSLKEAVAEFAGKPFDQLLQDLLGGTLSTENLDLSSLTFSSSLLSLNLDIANVSVSYADGLITNLSVSTTGISLATTEINYGVSTNITAPQVSTYTNIASKLDVLQNVRKVIDTYKSMKTPYVIGEETHYGLSLASDLYVRFGNNIFTGDIELMTIPTLVEDEVKTKLYVALNAEMQGFSAKVYLVDTTVYVNVQGLMIKVELNKTEIDYICSWVNSTFGMDINLDGFSGGLNVSMPDLSTLSFNGDGNELYAYLQKLSVNTTRFEELEVKLFTPNTLNRILIGANVYDQNITDLGVGDFTAGECEDSTTLSKNLVFNLSKMSYGETLNNIKFTSNGITLGGVHVSEYSDYRLVLDFVTSLLNYLNDGKYAFTLNADVSEGQELFASVNNAVIEINNQSNNIDLSGNTKFGLNINYLYLSGLLKLRNGYTEEGNAKYITHDISGKYTDNALHVTYTNDQSVNDTDLRLKISNTAIKEVLAIALQVFAIDLGGLEAEFNLPTYDLDVANLQYLFGIESTDVGSQFEQIDSLVSDIGTLLDSVKDINFAQNVVNGVNIQRFVVSINLAGTIMELTIQSANGQLNYIAINNLQVDKDRVLNLSLDVTEYTGNKEYDTANHFDLSNISDILLAFVNNSKYNDFRITGTLVVNIEVIGINIDMDIPMDIRVKLVDKKPQVYIRLEVPVIGSNVPVFNGINVNMDVPYKLGDAPTTSTRYVDIMYKDDYIYTYRTEKVGGQNRTYEKALKQHADVVFNDIMAYVQYTIGFTDQIMDAINDAIAKSLNRDRPIDFTNVINDYGYNSETDTHDIQINLAEIANNEQLESGTINIYTRPISDTNTEEIISQLDLDVHMPLATGVVLDLYTGNTKLVDVGLPVDMSRFNEFVAGFDSKAGEDIYYEASNGSWSKASEKTYTITFNSNGGDSVNSITNKQNTPITMPTLSYKYVTDGNTRYIYSFGGWYENPEFEGDAVNYTTQPRGDKTLYAKWIHVDTEYVYTVTFVSNGVTTFNPVEALQNTWIDVSGYIPHKHDDTKITNWATKCTHTRYTFEGWYTNSGLTNKFDGYVRSNLTLYAKYTTSTTSHGTAFGICTDNCQGC